MLPVGPASPFTSNQAQLAGLQVEAGYVVTEVLLAHVVDLASADGLVFHDDAHRRHLGFGVRAQPPHIQGFALRMRQDERARQPLDALQRDGTLAAQLFAPSFPPCQHLGMAPEIGLAPVRHA